MCTPQKHGATQLSYYTQMAVADTGQSRSVAGSVLAARFVADAMIMRALIDIAGGKEPYYSTAVAFFESGLYRLYADILDFEHEPIFREYQLVKSGEKEITPFGYNAPMNEEAVAKARELSEQGLTNVEIARQIGWSSSAVGTVTRDITQKRRRVVTPEEHERIRALYLAGHSRKEIEGITGWSWYAVSKHTEDLRDGSRRTSSNR